MDAYDKYENGSLLNGRYLKVSDISEGSYGLVSLAKDTKHDLRLVAVKFIYPVDYKRKDALKHLSNTTGRATSSPAKLRSNAVQSASQQKSMLTLLRDESNREIAIHKILGDHPNVPSLVDHFDLCLVLEYCARGDLYEAMQNDLGPSTSQDIKDVFDQILSAILFCHGKSVYHRDLKPENILITQDWSIKVCDWGLATTTQIVTNPAEFDVGSERYMAPELFDPDLASYDAAKVDLWSLGVILLTLVFHKNPFQIANYTDKRFLQFSVNREALFDFFSSMTGDMFSALRFCLTLDPANRDLEAFRNELTNVKFFTIDEEYWSLHSGDEEEEEEVGYEEDDERDLAEAEAEPASDFDFNGDLFEFEAKEEPEKPVRRLQIITPDEPVRNSRAQYLLDDGLGDSDTTATNISSVPRRDDGKMPYNRRADALLLSTRPIPIGGKQQIRNTRKPFGVASYNRAGAFASIKHPPASTGGYGGSHGGKFRREDFFTPRSVFSHYMDKYGEGSEQREQRDVRHDKRKRWSPAYRKQLWKKKPQGGHGERRNTHRRARPQLGFGLGHLHPMAELGHPGDRYIPPFLRLPQHGRLPLVDLVVGQFDEMALQDDVFMLDDYEHDKRPADARPSGRRATFHEEKRAPFHDDKRAAFPEEKRAPFPEDRRGPFFAGEHGASLQVRRYSERSEASGKYIPPFRRGSIGVPVEKRKLCLGRPAALFEDETSRSVPGENWMSKRVFN